MRLSLLTLIATLASTLAHAQITRLPQDVQEALADIGAEDDDPREGAFDRRVGVSLRAEITPANQRQQGKPH